MVSYLKSQRNNFIFQIGDANKPAIFGISFWAHEDCPQLTSHLSEKISMYNLDDPNIFWDDNIIEILGKISVKNMKYHHMLPVR